MSRLAIAITISGPCGQTQKQQKVTQEHGHARRPPKSLQSRDTRLRDYHEIFRPGALLARGFFFAEPIPNARNCLAAERLSAHHGTGPASAGPFFIWERRNR